MSTFLLCISILVGICAFGFIFAGVVTFNDPKNPVMRRYGWILIPIDMLLSLGLFTMLYTIVRNWRRKPEARRLLYMGAGFLAVTVGLVWIAFRL